jgi:hypothetical protein
VLVRRGCRSALRSSSASDLPAQSGASENNRPENARQVSATRARRYGSSEPRGRINRKARLAQHGCVSRRLRHLLLNRRNLTNRLAHPMRATGSACRRSRRCAASHIYDDPLRVVRQGRLDRNTHVNHSPANICVGNVNAWLFDRQRSWPSSRFSWLQHRSRARPKPRTSPWTAGFRQPRR